ncbi:hypothetical protein M422DRAFT_158281, partial [Sphaerobolus stellatus SS14]
IVARDSHMRGSLKDKLIPLVRETYGFKNSAQKKDIMHNGNLYDLLKSDNRFVFKNIRERKGLYESPIVQQAINQAWFQDPSDTGVKYSSYFNPTPIRTIALIFTVVSPMSYFSAVYFVYSHCADRICFEQMGQRKL